MAWKLLGQGVICALRPHPFVSLCPLCGGADEFLSLKPTINAKYNLGIKVHFPFHPQLPSVSFGVPGIPDTFFYFFNDTLFRWYNPLYSAIKV